MLDSIIILWFSIVVFLQILVSFYFIHLSREVASGGDITLCIKFDKPIVAYWYVMCT